MTHWWSAAFFACSLVSLSTAVLNMEGTGIADGSSGAQQGPPMYTAHTIGNADTLYACYGACESVLCAILVWFMFWQANKCKSLSRRIMHGDLSAKNYTVMVGRMPVDARDSQAAHDFFSQWGDVVHVGVSFDWRELILATRYRHTRREKLHASQVQWYLAKSNGYPKKKLDRATTAVAKARHKLFVADVACKALLTKRYACTGYVFVTFDTVDAAQACIGACNTASKYFFGSGPLTVKMAPEPEDIIWENLQYSKFQRAAR
eukprot:1666803-Pleurochrysis_carterae.AAC.1